jgi:hypothetical protein
MASSPGSAAGTQDSAASTRADAIEKDANWDFSAASQTVNITKSLYLEEMRRVTPFGHKTFGAIIAHVRANSGGTHAYVETDAHVGTAVIGCPSSEARRFLVCHIGLGR